MRAYAAAHREELAAAKRAWRAANADYVRDYRRAQYAKRCLEGSDGVRDWGRSPDTKLRRLDKRNERQRERYRSDPEYREARRREGRERYARRTSLVAADVWRCAYCGRSGSEGSDPDGVGWQVDHVVPLAGGGLESAANLVLACEACNLSKNDDPPEVLWARRMLTVAEAVLAGGD